MTSSIAIDVVNSLSARNIYGNPDLSGKFVLNPVQYSFTHHELREKYLSSMPPKSSPFYNEESFEVCMILTDQHLVVRDKVKSIMVNYNDIFKPILIAKFEESPYFLVLDGNHRLAAAVLLRQRYINAFFVDARESFL
jgi:hypothetical protein